MLSTIHTQEKKIGQCNKSDGVRSVRLCTKLNTRRVNALDTKGGLTVRPSNQPNSGGFVVYYNSRNLLSVCSACLLSVEKQHREKVRCRWRAQCSWSVDRLISWVGLLGSVGFPSRCLDHLSPCSGLISVCPMCTVSSDPPGYQMIAMNM
jgi:hypothetical protein